MRQTRQTAQFCRGRNKNIFALRIPCPQACGYTFAPHKTADAICQRGKKKSAARMQEFRKRIFSERNPSDRKEEKKQKFCDLKRSVHIAGRPPFANSALNRLSAYCKMPVDVGISEKERTLKEGKILRILRGGQTPAAFFVAGVLLPLFLPLHIQKTGIIAGALRTYNGRLCRRKKGAVFFG